MYMTAIAMLGTAGVVLLIVFLNPDKTEKWASLFWKVLAGCGRLFRGAHRRYVKHDLQSRVNEFVSSLKRSAPALATDRLALEYVDPDLNRKAFLDGGRAVIRLKRDDPEDLNFVHGAYLFTSQCLLEKPKRYLAPSQREALDLFVCGKLIEAQKSSVRSIYIDEYLHPRTRNPKSAISKYLDSFESIEEGRLFFPVLLQELEFLGERVFGGRKDSRINVEVKSLISFLRRVAERVVGEEMELEFEGQYCRFGIVIVGRAEVISLSIQPYVNFIRRELVPRDAESIYVLGDSRHRESIDRIAVEFASGYERIRHRLARRKIRFGDGSEESVDQYLVVLRRRALPLVRASNR